MWDIWECLKNVGTFVNYRFLRKFQAIFSFAKIFVLLTSYQNYKKTCTNHKLSSINHRVNEFEHVEIIYF